MTNDQHETPASGAEPRPSEVSAVDFPVAESPAVEAPRPGWRPGPGSFLAVLVGVIAGVLLYLPWDTMWNLALRQVASHLAQRAPGVHLDWQSVDRAGPLHFRINGLSCTGPGWVFAPRLSWVEVRLGATPLVAVTADSGGREARVLYFDSGSFECEGQVNLACLGRRDVSGSVDVRSQGLLPRGQSALEKGFLDVRGQSVHLPDSLWLGDVSLSLEYKEGALRIRSFTLREPVQVRAEGTAHVLPQTPLASPYAVSGEVVRGQQSMTFNADGALGEFLGSAAVPR